MNRVCVWSIAGTPAPTQADFVGARLRAIQHWVGGVVWLGMVVALAIK